MRHSQREGRASVQAEACPQFRADAQAFAAFAMKKALGPGDWSEGLAAKCQPEGGTDGENSPKTDYG